jgi:hypothetical protein
MSRSKIRLWQRERVANEVNLWLVVVQPHFHHIEAVVDLRIVQQAQPGQRAAGDELLLREIHGFEGRPEVLTSPRLHLDEDERVARPVAADEIDFAAAGRAEIPVENLEPLRTEMAFGETLAAATEPVPQILRPAAGEPPPQVRKTVDESRKDHGRAA